MYIVVKVEKLEAWLLYCNRMLTYDQMLPRPNLQELDVYVLPPSPCRLSRRTGSIPSLFCQGKQRAVLTALTTAPRSGSAK